MVMGRSFIPTLGKERNKKKQAFSLELRVDFSFPEGSLDRFQVRLLDDEVERTGKKNNNKRLFCRKRNFKKERRAFVSTTTTPPPPSLPLCIFELMMSSCIGGNQSDSAQPTTNEGEMDESII